MANTFGHLFRITTWGESHGGGVGVVVDGCPPRLPLTEADIQPDLDRRRPGQSPIVSQRKESDTIQILSGTFEGKTLGTPISLWVKNADARSEAYTEMATKFRPSHADYTYQAKYGIRDHRGGGFIKLVTWSLPNHVSALTPSVDFSSKARYSCANARWSHSGIIQVPTSPRRSNAVRWRALSGGNFKEISFTFFSVDVDHEKVGRPAVDAEIVAGCAPCVDLCGVGCSVLTPITRQGWYFGARGDRE